MRVHTYISIYVHTYISIYVYTYIYIYAHTHICIYICVYTYIYTCIYTHTNNIYKYMFNVHVVQHRVHVRWVHHPSM